MTRLKQLLLLLLVVVASIPSFGQKVQTQHRLPIWSHHQKNQRIHGVSIGLWSGFKEPMNTNTNGIKLELIGAGIVLPLAPRSPIDTNENAYIARISEPLSERINGLNLSASGSLCDCQTNGISLGMIGQYNRTVNGISASMIMNFSQNHNGIMAGGYISDAYKMNGIQLSLFVNHSKVTRGIQIALFNKSENLKGIQIGLWNVNQKRKMPIINWSF